MFQKSGGIPLLADVLSRFADNVSVVQFGSMAVARAVAGLEANKVEFVEAGGLCLLSDALRLHLNNEDVVEQVIRAVVLTIVGQFVYSYTAVYMVYGAIQDIILSAAAVCVFYSTLSALCVRHSVRSL